jgi:tetratricopeptide (TPR) repeat protein
MNSLGVVFDEFNKNAPKGMHVEVARQGKNGVLHPAKPQEMATLETKSRIANTANLLKKLSKEEKLEWAIATKDEANVLYQQNKYSEAMEKYVECLTATDFGTNTANVVGTETDEPPSLSSSSSGNVDELVIPVLCNLAACCVQIQAWNKAIMFADQALQLQPNCRKAAYRQGVGYVHVHEYSAALKSFANALESGGTMPLSETEKFKLTGYHHKALEGYKQEQQALAKQKAALQKAFASTSITSISRNDLDNDEDIENKKETSPMGIRELFVIMIKFILLKILSILHQFFSAILGKKAKKEK